MMSIEFPTIADFIGNTPLVRLQRMPGETSNTILVKLEGNNPAGSVKDRPALSMIERAEQRAEIVAPSDVVRVQRLLSLSKVAWVIRVSSCTSRRRSNLSATWLM